MKNMQELSLQDLDAVNGGNPAAVVRGAFEIAGYLGSIDVFYDFGYGLGVGFYDATHPEIP